MCVQFILWSRNLLHLTRSAFNKTNFNVNRIYYIFTFFYDVCRLFQSLFHQRLNIFREKHRTGFWMKATKTSQMRWKVWYEEKMSQGNVPTVMWKNESQTFVSVSVKYHDDDETFPRKTNFFFLLWMKLGVINRDGMVPSAHPSDRPPQPERADITRLRW